MWNLPKPVESARFRTLKGTLSAEDLAEELDPITMIQTRNERTPYRQMKTLWDPMIVQ
jgi:hypothetical protein